MDRVASLLNGKSEHQSVLKDSINALAQNFLKIKYSCRRFEGRALKCEYNNWNEDNSLKNKYCK